LAHLLDIELKILTFLIYKLDSSQRYYKFDIKKKIKGTRQITAPIGSLKTIQKKLLRILEVTFLPRISAHGFIKNKSIVTNAENHCKKNYILNIDLKDFFPSIHFGRVRGLFMARPFLFSDRISTLLAQICCFEKRLPQGAPTSPIISNMICFKMDKQLLKLASKSKCYYTRFADDITISTNLAHFPDHIAQIINTSNGVKIVLGNELNAIITTDNGFQINQNKLRLFNKNRRQEVTGLVTNKFTNVKRVYLRQVSAMLHAWGKFGLDNAEKEHFIEYRKEHLAPFKQEPTFESIVKGKINFIKMVRGPYDPIYTKLYNKYVHLNPLSGLQLIESPEEKIKKSLWVLECNEGPADDLNQGTGFYLNGYGLVTCAHVISAKTKAFSAMDPSTKFPVGIVKWNEELDLAILDINCPTKYCLEKGNTKNTTHGDSLCIWGFPNYEPSNPPGMLSAKVHYIRTEQTTSGPIKLVIVDETIWGGNSGGPVLNEKNQVVGIAAKGFGVGENKVIPIESLDNI